MRFYTQIHFFRLHRANTRFDIMNNPGMAAFTLCDANDEDYQGESE
jgi:hypothetical protein